MAISKGASRSSRGGRSGIASRQSSSTRKSGIAARQGQGVTDYKPLNTELKRQALDRDDYTCQCCTKSKAEFPSIILTVDHIVPRARGGLDILRNLKTLCVDCHSFKKTGSANRRGAKLLQGMKRHVEQNRSDKKDRRTASRGESWKDYES